MSVSDSLLKDVMCSLTEPALLVDARHNLVFATDSFSRVVGCRLPACSCDFLMVPSFSDQGHAVCCWDVLDGYLSMKTNGLWLIKRIDGSYLPALCSNSPVDISGVHRYIHIKVKLLTPPVGAMELLYQSVCKQLGDVRQHRTWVEGYFRNTWGVQPEWVKIDKSRDETGNLVLEGLEQTQCSGPFDLTLHKGKQLAIRRIFPPQTHGATEVLMLKGEHGELREDLLMNAWAAVRAMYQESAHLLEMPASLKLCPLRPREREVPALIAHGMSDREIAANLHISIHTAKNHARNIMHKCGINRRIKLATLFRQME